VASWQQMPNADAWNRDKHLLENSQVQCLTEKMTQVALSNESLVSLSHTPYSCLLPTALYFSSNIHFTLK
jgi:hypothetical protein